MTKAQDIRELLAEQRCGPGERQALEELAEALEETLSQEVPHRPEFRALLREQLVAEARRRLVPWYRRPALWGPALGLAAAAVVMAVGLGLWQDAPMPETNGAGNGRIAVHPGGNVQEIDSSEVKLNPELVARLTLPQVRVPDEVLPPDHPGAESIANLNWEDGLKVYQVMGRPDRSQVEAMARALGFERSLERIPTGYQVEEDGRRLQVTEDGQVTYEDRRPAPDAGPSRIDAEDAQQVARQFLDMTALPMPSLPTVSTVLNPRDGKTLFVVTYAYRVDGRPVVNARTTVRVDPSGRVAAAEAFVPGNEQEIGRYAVITPDEALRQARQQGRATFDTVDLVYVRTVDGKAVFLQPYWRTFGRDAQGNRLARYVSALITEDE